MKISKIIIKDYLHFKKNLEIDLTYPKSHPKAGKALDKVCFLGQSGTGKTTILNLIKYFICENGDYDKKCIELNKLREDSVEVFFKAQDEYYSKSSRIDPYKFSLTDYSRTPPKNIQNPEVFAKDLEAKLTNRKIWLINFPFCIVGPQNIIEKPTDQYLKGATKFDAPTGEILNVPDTNKRIWDFNQNNINDIWKIVFNEVAEHIVKYQSKEIDLSKKIRETHEKHENITKRNKESTKIVNEFKRWEKKSPNPIKSLAEKCLDIILNKFNLQVESDLSKYSMQSDENERYIIIKSRNKGEEILYPYLSTGTKQIILTAIPLFFLKPKETIILFDQPETSLYPNIQWLLPGIYLEIAPDDNQFFFATHSPVVASSFDPWEIVELDFDEKNGEVYRKEYYDLENKRDMKSYTINPKLLRWDSSYRMLFNLEKQGNEERRIKMRELSALEATIKTGSFSKSRKKTLVEEYLKLARLLDWNI